MGARTGLTAGAWLVLLLLSLAGQPAGIAADANPPLRIGILPACERGRVESEGALMVIDAASHARLADVPAGLSLIVEPAVRSGQSQLRLQVGDQVLTAGAVRVAATASPQTISVAAAPPGEAAKTTPQRSYRGRLDITPLSGAKFMVTNVVFAEDYLRSVVPAEMGADAPLEALKAQAVASRTFALGNRGKHAKDGFDLCAGVHCQVYKGADAERPSTDQAVQETAGLVMKRDGMLVSAPFHSTCGGRTEDAQNVWGSPSPVLQSVRCSAQGEGSSLKSEETFAQFLADAQGSYCRGSRLFRWERRYSREEVQERLEANLKDDNGNPVRLGKLTGLSVLQRSDSGRVLKLRAYGTKANADLSRESIRWAFGDGSLGGEGSLPSLLFRIVKSVNGNRVQYIISGGGWGHGVGMCQNGAIGMARAGKDFRAVLQHYYQGIALEPLA